MPRYRVNDLYARSRPRGSNSERHPNPPDPSRYPDHREIQQPQAPEDQQGAGYHNDHPNDWVRGAGENATRKPDFDHSPPRDKMRR